MTRLLAHFWTAADSEESREAQIEDWLDDLREFGPAIVSEACREWRRQPGRRRPLPGDIRALCLAEQRNRQARAELKALPSPDRAAMAEQDRQKRRDLEMEGRQLANDWARNHGYADMDDALRHGRRYSEVIASFMPVVEQMPGFKTPGAVTGTSPESA